MKITLLSSYFKTSLKKNFHERTDVFTTYQNTILQKKFLAWFHNRLFSHTILILIAQARKKIFRPQKFETMIPLSQKQSDYVLGTPEWSSSRIYKTFPQSISSQAIGTISYIRDLCKSNTIKQLMQTPLKL